MSKCPSQQYPECWFGCPEKATCLDLSPPPVVEDLGERILEQAEVLIKSYQERVDRVVTDEVFEKVVRTFPNSILKLIEEAGYVKLIPDPLKGTPIIKDIAKFVDSASEEGT